MAGGQGGRVAGSELKGSSSGRKLETKGTPHTTKHENTLTLFRTSITSATTCTHIHTSRHEHGGIIL